MKSQAFWLIAVISFTSLTAGAQEKPAAVQPSKSKSAKAEKGYTLIEKGLLLSKATFRKDAKAAGNIIEIEALNVSGGSVSLAAGGILPPANISQITTITGNHLSTRDISRSGRGVVMQLVDVTYPYRARITVSEQILEFEIVEPGVWKINVAVSE
jgi:hypothetical protein